MNEAVLTRGWELDSVAEKALKGAATFWFAAAVAGQWIFVTYIVSFYGRAIVFDDMAAWSQHGYAPGNQMHNVALATHLLLAAIITFGGPLQLIPQVRFRAPMFHRWNGRVYLLAASTAAIAGLFMMWTRGTVGGMLSHLAISLNAVLILVCAAIALRHALARRFSVHRRWALRLFLLVSGVWFFRVGLMLWLVINKAPVGFDPKTFEGSFLDFLSFAQYLLPLAILELYLYAQDRAGAAGKLAAAAVLSALTVAMGVGIAGASMAVWLPRILTVA